MGNIIIPVFTTSVFVIHIGVVGRVTSGLYSLTIFHPIVALWVPRSNTILSSFTPSICISYVKVVPWETRGNKILPSFTLIVCASPMGVVPAITRRYTFQSFFSPSICVSHMVVCLVTPVTTKVLGYFCCNWCNQAYYHPNLFQQKYPSTTLYSYH